MMLLSKFIDAALLSPTSTPADVKKLCSEAKKYGFYGVDALPCYASIIKKEIAGSGIKQIAVVGYPLGLNTTSDKVFETKEAVKNGAHEIDMVMNIGWFKAKRYDKVMQDIKQVVKAAKRTVKVIIETGYLTDAEITKAAKLVKKSGAHFVKTCTGYGPRGVTVKDVKLIKKAVGKFNIKASGGIRTAKQAIALIKAGATRIGTSSGAKIVGELKQV